MERAQEPAAHPAQLPPGTVVGSWRVVGWGGRGVYGAVYRAVHVAREDEGLASSVALKMGLLPEDPHFEREVELLSRTRHPSIPRLWDSGVWRSPSGAVHPFIVMDWVDGVPLYEWARRHDPSSQQVCRWLAQLAGALAAVRGQGCVHRDVKGGNVLVRHADGRAMLTDFGSSRYPEATLLTPPHLVPGTPAYQPPEAALFPLRYGRDGTARYQAGPADDVYALGVLAYRLVTGQYPELGEPFKDATGFWQPGELGSPPPHVLNPRVESRLGAVILRMLSVRPEERGTAAELARVLEQAAQHPQPESTRPLFEREEQVPAAGNGAEEPEGQVPGESSAGKRSGGLPMPRAHARPWRPWLALAAGGLVVVAWAGGSALDRLGAALSISERMAAGADTKDAGTSGLGDAASSVSSADSAALPGRERLAEEPLPEPVQEQARPDANGRCASKRQIALNGGCWIDMQSDREGCEEAHGQMFKGRCYMPVIPPGRSPTSSPPHKP